MQICQGTTTDDPQCWLERARIRRNRLVANIEGYKADPYLPTVDRLRVRLAECEQSLKIVVGEIRRVVALGREGAQMEELHEP